MESHFPELYATLRYPHTLSFRSSRLSSPATTISTTIYVRNLQQESCHTASAPVCHNTARPPMIDGVFGWVVDVRIPQTMGCSDTTGSM
jgi:hypothetical protein